VGVKVPQDKIRYDNFVNVQQVTINRSKGLLGTSETIHSGSVSATPIKANLSSKVKDLESKVYPQRNKKIQGWES
jgi:hypothetical protein